ncbi:transcriptional regulator, TetR family [Kribbella flavida DSM 17836]|uniref:Transcriptional regulator, TetR family n=1 Tax=Kribbella flavida (strain DSM 17836 / JCM 10339 / NBRC 14399) TaxID=479435 RepID=D2PKZ0_KRIFD|nr:TetR/AcrR family transcriptional regulator [Kribbella flavida]ADB32457.1 transcriptional regulator, TetR family [Kribbella flavida DSM 17836]
MSSALLAIGRRRTTAERRRDRERDIIRCTRELFDERGSIDAQIDDIAKRVGINKALIYRHFAGKEELFALTLVDYLGELDGRLEAVDGPRRAPLNRLRALSEVFVDFCLEYPAFADCAMSLLRRTGDELFGEITEPVMTKLGAAMASALERISTILQAGQRAGVFDEVDTAYLANHLYTQTLGSLHMARMGLIVSAAQPGHPVVHHADIDTVRSTAITATLATAVGRKALSPAGKASTKSARTAGTAPGKPLRATAGRSTPRTAGEKP